MESTEVLALLYSDGSAGILKADASVEDARAERKIADKNEIDRAQMTKIAKVRIELVEMIDDPERSPLENNIPGVEATLRAIADDPSTPPHLRLIAKNALSHGQRPDGGSK